MFNSGTSARTASEVARKSRPPSRTSSGGARRRERLVLGMQGARRSSPNEPGLSRQAGSLVVWSHFRLAIYRGRSGVIDLPDRQSTPLQAL